MRVYVHCTVTVFMLHSVVCTCVVCVCCKTVVHVVQKCVVCSSGHTVNVSHVEMEELL